MTTMKYVDEFRNPELIRKISEEIHRHVDPDYHYRFMEVCGGHTFSIFRFGLQNLLPENIELVHGPGCPVCILPMGRMDNGLSIAKQQDVIFTAFGDVMRVPGKHGTPLELKAKGADIRMVYSPLDALNIAMKNPDRQVVLFAIGFETTAPSTALTLMRARELDVPNFSVFSNHVLIIPAMQAILDSPDMRIDGFIGPGHVSSVIGARPYESIAKKYQKPIIISGFEPLDLLQSILMLVKQMREGRFEVENQYSRVVPYEGNMSALDVMKEVFEVRSLFEWRGLGAIQQSALKLRPEFAKWDAEVRFQVEGARVSDPQMAPCGQVLKGILKPHQCQLFGKECTPEHPVGALMVSSEGACAAYYHYVHLQEAVGE
ncbi:hydrogenase formation protein HypD [Aeribacillus composti]|uniref:hydrogenase formation protein HypD n=1 Tax=Aeribacillus TaxID=1055323 RepID=UPI000AC4715C|nr:MULTISPECIES: hydrogenase formation protein HypD [Aeribacillus]MED0650792.1 hydrogenase formation protein HypD [Aeribacillus composti]MED0715017.1 hydrogenase formation protein HypD [Aeribacillus composti]MED0744398.1 hydrogenase formation protein HypD [Aeribacillus composti]MED4487907.1 hydrogenase formation protein HypD [Aeribacillus pallidus]TVZ78206.1 hydrogenase maturation protein HypD [Aeribacillus composti]